MVPAVPQEFEMHTLDAARSQDAKKYESYLQTTVGRLRCDLSWENLRRFLPEQGCRGRALDLGGGTGVMSERLAKMGFEVVLLDHSEEMLGIARRAAERGGVVDRIDFRQADAGRLCDLFQRQSFDIVLCHNLLEYVADPNAVIRYIAQIVRDQTVVSILVRNRAGEVLRAAIKSGNLKLAITNLSAETVVDSLYNKAVRVFDPMGLIRELTEAGLNAIDQYGVRVVSDYVSTENQDGESYRELFELELMLGAQPRFAAIARYSQLIARRPCSSEHGET
jgi:S-adenosylmethionine-dependent methyltransferase